jgi:hypothetical protein
MDLYDNRVVLPNVRRLLLQVKDFQFYAVSYTFKPTHIFRAVFGKLGKQPERPFQLFFRHPD